MLYDIRILDILFAVGKIWKHIKDNMKQCRDCKQFVERKSHLSQKQIEGEKNINAKKAKMNNETQQKGSYS